MKTKPTHIQPVQSHISLAERRKRNGHGSMLLWFTGLSGSGKTTLARAVEQELHIMGWQTFLLDGDSLRHGLNSDLGFSPQDRQENIRRAGEVGRLLVEAGLVVLAAFISPFREDRERVRALFAPGEFAEIHLECDLTTCEERDPKGLYRRARAGEIPEFTGISSPYEPPDHPELRLDTARMDPEGCTRHVLDLTLAMDQAQRGDDHS